MQEIHTKQLREQFHDVYEKFFQENEIVTSAPLSLRITGRRNTDSQSLLIYNNINLRGYTGIHITSKTGAEVNIGIQNYNAKDNTFEKIFPLFDADIDGFKEGLEYTLYEELKFPKDIGIKISWLFEILMDMRTPTIHTASISLALALMILTKKVTKEEAEKLTTLSSKELKKDKQGKLLIKLIYRMGELLYPGKMTPNHIAVQGGATPAIIIVEKGHAEAKNTELKDRIAEIDKNGARDKSFYINELYPHFKEIQYDVAFINTGVAINPRRINSYIAQQKHELEEADQFRNDLKSKLEKDYDIHLENSDTENTELMIRNMYTQNINLLRAFIEAGTNPIYGPLILMDSLKKISHLRELYALNPNLEAVKNAIADSELTIVPDIYGFGSANQFAIHAKLGQLQSHLPEYLERLRTEFPHTFIYYKNWESNEAPEGIKVDQNIFAHQQKKQDLVRVYIYENETVTESIVPVENLPKISNAFKVCLDNRNGKIYIDGEKVHSDGIKSQKFATQMIRLALEAENRTLNSKDMPHGSYRDSLNTIKSKIINPFEEIAKENKQDIKISTNHLEQDYFSVTIHGKGTFALIGEKISTNPLQKL